MKRRRRPPKRKTQHAHAAFRASQRYGLEAGDVEEIERRIRNGDTRMVHRQSNRVVHHEVVYNGRPIVVVYDKHRGQAVTFLPPMTSRL